MDRQNSGQPPEEKKLESIIVALATRLEMEPETVRHYLMNAYRELWGSAVIKDFIPILAMRRVRDQFSAGKVKGKQQ